MTDNHDEIALSFYSFFQEKDGLGMTSLYHPDLEFEDPAFGPLNYNRTCAMWKMLTKGDSDLIIDYRLIGVKENIVNIEWIASYTFSKTGKPVKNIIQAEMTIRDGLIFRHQDRFNLHRWASQAFGIKGWLLGSTGYFKRQLQAQTNRSLDRFMAQEPN